VKIIEVEKLWKEYGPLVAVRDVSFSVDRGQVVGLIGPNGAGKTTLLKMLSTLLPPTRGSGRVAGYDLGDEVESIRRNIGYLPDFFNLYPDLTVRECLEFFARAYGVNPNEIAGRIDRILKLVHLEEKRNDFLRHLSRGMVQRMGVAVNMVHDPEVLLLDEPASGLDPQSRIQLRNLLRTISQEGKTVLISSHILTELDGFCTHIAVMDQGKLILFGSVREIQDRISKTKKIQISVLEDMDRAIELTKTFPEITLLSRQDHTFQVEMVCGRERLAELNGYLMNQGVKVYGFSEISSNLEDLFMKISSGTSLPS
jgi:ABC-2 type transport system ATP-binding protein